VVPDERIPGMAKVRPLEGIEQVEKIWSWIERFGVVKTMLIATAGGTAFTFAVSWFQHFPRWLILSLVFVVSSLLTLVVAAGVLWLIAFIKHKVKEIVSESPYRKRVIALEQIIGPRQISEVQRQHLLNELSKVTGSVKITAVNGDEDAGQYADQFATLFGEAGWRVWGVERPYDSRLGSYGIGMTLLSKNFGIASYPPALHFAEALGRAGFVFNNIVSWELVSDSCELIIGHRGEATF
jgi:hypothetical protein